MKKVKYLLLVILLFLSFNVKASETCEKDELNRLKELAKKVEFDYNYKLVDDEAQFSITAVNLNSDLKVVIIEDYYNDIYKEFKDNTSHSATLNNFKSGEKVVVTIKAYVPNWCSGKVLLTKTIKLPYYNYFYSDTDCYGNEDFKYCKQLIDNNIDEEEYVNAFMVYLTEKENQNVEVVSANSTWKLLIIIGSIVVVLGILVGITMLIVRRRKKNRL